MVPLYHGGLLFSSSRRHDTPRPCGEASGIKKAFQNPDFSSSLSQKRGRAGGPTCLAAAVVVVVEEREVEEEQFALKEEWRCGL
ncbi:hypothetical protein E2C01_002867 [Portunus trituberculatus]|uniref:Uncharacterized protein n=1 Tax=Portunus trituberculatus TaxID=210409 RepID=A0A5B7CPC0_PORTR|nr:hypothetical protein [Portunus trituberculatus]